MAWCAGWGGVSREMWGREGMEREGKWLPGWREGEKRTKEYRWQRAGRDEGGRLNPGPRRPSQPASAVRPQDAVVGECDQSKMAARPPCRQDRLSLRTRLGVEPQQRAARPRRQSGGNVPSNKISEKL